MTGDGIMFKIIKKTGKILYAYRLGEKNDVLEELMHKGKIREIYDGLYEIFSQEAKNGKGEIAHKGDYIKIDSSGSPYPNDETFFKKNHRRIEGNRYEQIPKPLDAWTVQESMCEEVDFLIQKKGLVINVNEKDRYFNAELWGAKLSSARDSVIVFYSIDRDSLGNIIDVDFNFVCRDEFEKTYIIY